MPKNPFNERTVRRMHRKLWNWLAENPDEQKYAWPGWDDSSLKEKHHAILWRANDAHQCFACMWAREQKEAAGKNTCDNCPCIWTVDGKRCCSFGSPYFEWDNIVVVAGVFTDLLARRSHLARRIRDSWPRPKTSTTERATGPN